MFSNRNSAVADRKISRDNDAFKNCTLDGIDTSSAGDT